MKAARFSRDDSFGRSTRFYEVGGVRYPSVTSILQSINKPALVNWAAKSEREMCIEASANLYEDTPGTPKMSRASYVATLTDRIGKQKAHAKILAQASDVGTQLHALIEWNMRKELQQAVGPEPRVIDAASWAFMAYEDWRKAANLAPLLIEQTVWSMEYGYAGTLDWLGEIDTEEHERLRVVGDWKTGKAIYGEALLQNAAYTMALREMGHGGDVQGGCIVRLPKIQTDPGFEVRIVTAEEQIGLFSVFLNAMKIWQWQESERKAKEDA